jgi:hypothetical protein
LPFTSPGAVAGIVNAYCEAIGPNDEYPKLVYAGTVPSVVLPTLNVTAPVGAIPTLSVSTSAVIVSMFCDCDPIN